ncbi:hypothetical protein [Paraburkholderia graminis]|uniref:Uncharacterized protein n=1 Tax=Paraburkholderia graminis TaxID=60548 RepID=A0ABD5CS54_9BURK|nr:hypothetical protein [Paraburkholderia graminis]MDR6208163.1 hypothetical protein [Paraburkholderia graminis]
MKTISVILLLANGMTLAFSIDHRGGVVTMAFGVAVLLASLLTLGISLVKYWAGEHYSVAVECRKVLEPDGQERDHYSFTGSRSNTFIGRTVGRVYIAFAEGRYDRMVRKHRPATTA